MAVAPRDHGRDISGPALRLDKLRGEAHATIERRLEPVTAVLARRGVRPNQVTVVGTLVSLGAPALILADRPALAGIVWLAGSSLDLLDGALARRHTGVTAGGAFLDSTLDRVSEGVLFAAIAYRFAALGEPVNAAVTVLSLLGSFLISYTRARAEALGARCKVGLVTRAERVLLLGLGLCFDLLAPAVYLLLALAAVTATQRIRHSLEALR